MAPQATPAKQILWFAYGYICIYLTVFIVIAELILSNEFPRLGLSVWLSHSLNSVWPPFTTFVLALVMAGMQPLDHDALSRLGDIE